MKLQETPDEIPEGGTPHTVSLLMHDKLVDTGKPGDRVEVKLHCNVFISRRILTFLYIRLMSSSLCIRLLGFTGL